MGPRLLLFTAFIFVMCDSTERVVNVQKDKKSDLVVDIYDPTLADNGTTLFTYRYDTGNPKIVQVDMQGKAVWEYKLSSRLKQYIRYGFDAEVIPNGNILIMLPRYAAIEITRGGNVVWGYTNEKLSHDVDRLKNGHTIMTFGANDRRTDIQVRELDSEGFIAWLWSAKDHIDETQYTSTNYAGWTRTNSVEKRQNGHTIVCLCNFHLIAELDTAGNVINKIGEGLLYYPHDPQVLGNGNILVTSQKPPGGISEDTGSVYEIDPATNTVVWSYKNKDWLNTQLTRDANRLSNGNTLITGSTQIIEITPAGKMVWRLKIKNADLPLNSVDIETRGFYKSQRLQ